MFRAAPGGSSRKIGPAAAPRGAPQVRFRNTPYRVEPTRPRRVPRPSASRAWQPPCSRAGRMAIWGIVPAAGAGTRIQPLAFSKELLPIAARQGDADLRPRAVGEFIVERLLAAGADRLCFVIAPGKSDIVQYFGGAVGDAPICYVLQDRPAGLCHAVFRAARLVHPDDRVFIGLPDTVWFPIDALRALPAADVALLLFPVARPALFDAVVTRGDGSVVEIQVKTPNPTSHWVWGAMGMPGPAFLDLHELWLSRGSTDEYLGQLLNVWLQRGGAVRGVRAGEIYVDVGTVHGYREALGVLDAASAAATAPAGGQGRGRGANGPAAAESMARRGAP